MPTETGFRSFGPPRRAANARESRPDRRTPLRAKFGVKERGLEGDLRRYLQCLQRAEGMMESSWKSGDEKTMGEVRELLADLTRSMPYHFGDVCSDFPSGSGERAVKSFTSRLLAHEELYKLSISSRKSLDNVLELLWGRVREQHEVISRFAGNSAVVDGKEISRQLSAESTKEDGDLVLERESQIAELNEVITRQSTMLDQLLSEREQIDQHLSSRRASTDRRKLESELQMIDDSYLPDSVSQQHSPSQFSQHLPPKDLLSSQLLPSELPRHDQLPDRVEFTPHAITPIRHISDRSFNMNDIQVPWRSRNLVGHLDFPIASKSNHISDSYLAANSQQSAGAGEGQETAINRMKRWYQQRLSAHAGIFYRIKFQIVDRIQM